jgi:hypothetical protein
LITQLRDSSVSLFGPAVKEAGLIAVPFARSLSKTTVFEKVSARVRSPWTSPKATLKSRSRFCLSKCRKLASFEACKSQDLHRELASMKSIGHVVQKLRRVKGRPTATSTRDPQWPVNVDIVEKLANRATAKISLRRA